MLNTGSIATNKKLFKDTDGSLARLNRQLRLLEIEHEKKLQKLKSPYADKSNEFLDLCNKLNDIRNRDKQKLGKEIEDIETNVQDLSSVFKNREQLENTDEKQLCNKVIQTSRHIFSMKDSLQIELKQLQSEENKMIQDLNTRYKEIDEFAKRQGHKNSNILLKHKLKAALQANTSSSHQCQDVKNFQRFLDETGGHYGGWKEEDHLLFLKVSGKHKPHKTAELIHQQLPDKKLVDVLGHEEWYRKYIKLREAKKKAIAEWKEKHKEQNYKTQNKSDDTTTFMKRDPEEKLKIEQWKTEQQQRKDKELEEIKIKQILKQKEEEEKKKIMEQQRALLNKFKEEKRNCELSLAAARKQQEMEEAHQKALEANKMLKQFRLEDRKFTERIKARRTSLKSEDEVSVRSSVQAERDPERLLKPTQVWIQKTKRVDPEEEQTKSTRPLYILKVPHLGQPAWRKGLPS